MILCKSRIGGFFQLFGKQVEVCLMARTRNQVNNKSKSKRRTGYCIQRRDVSASAVVEEHGMIGFWTVATVR